MFDMIACSAFSFAFQMGAAKEADNKCKYAHCPASNNFKIQSLYDKVSDQPCISISQRHKNFDGLYDA